MCMFCVIQKWSRRVATMLPWLVIPLIGLWALSQLLPPAFRFEITSPRLACVFVLLVTLFWYEVLMPQLSAWRLRRNATLRERKRSEALELQKLKKTATRRCRNCLTPYRDQNPGGGKFMCSYCGHISKRPVLDLPVPPDMATNSGIIKELFIKSGKILNGKPWSDTVSGCNQEWLDNGNWVVNGSFPVRSAYPSQSNAVRFFGRREPCLGEKSYSGAYFFAYKLLMSFFMSIRWVWRKVFNMNSSKEDSSLIDDHEGMSGKGENGGTGQETRSEKARRKAEEKRQARLEKELLEEEERKQREEVARLVEERRRLRDEKREAENRAKGISSLKDKDNKKETEKKRQEKRKDKDKGSSKSNSDVEDLEKRVGKETETRRSETDRKSETDRRESPKIILDSVKGHNTETGHGAKGAYSNNYNRGHVGTRYFDRMKGTFLSSSRAFTGSSFFGKVAPAPVPAPKEIKAVSSVDLASNTRHDLHPSQIVSGKAIMNGDDKGNTRPVTPDAQCKTAPKSWQQLFTRSPAAPVPSHPNVISRPSMKSEAEVKSSEPRCLVSSVSSAPFYDNPINLPSPFILPPFSSMSVANDSLPAVKDPFFLDVAEMRHDILPEEVELFEDPCYVPDPVSLLGPVSESLDNFQLDRGTNHNTDKLGKSCPLINVSSPPDVSRPSPIESPMSKLRVADEKQNTFNHFFNNCKSVDMHTLPAADVNNIGDKGTWHMWNSSPLGPDGLSLIGDNASWIAPLERSRLNNEDMVHSSSQKSMVSLFTKESHITSGTHSPQKTLTGNAQHCTPFGSCIPTSNSPDPWLRKAFSPPLSSYESHSPISPIGEASQKILYGNPSGSATNHAFNPSASSCWSNRNEWAVQGSGEGLRNPSVLKPPVGGLYTPPDVQLLW